MSFLWRYFVVSVLVIGAALAFSALMWKENEKIRADYLPNQSKWLSQYFNYMKDNAPNTHQKFVEENPIPKN
jgi:hypothetical protein